MSTRIDPYTGQNRPDLPTIDAIAYFNATADGHYEVEGLAPAALILTSPQFDWLISCNLTILGEVTRVLDYRSPLRPGNETG